MDHGNTFEVFRLIADVALVPMAIMLWNIQGRLSRIEGQLMMRVSGVQE